MYKNRYGIPMSMATTQLNPTTLPLTGYEALRFLASKGVILTETRDMDANALFDYGKTLMLAGFDEAARVVYSQIMPKVKETSMCYWTKGDRTMADVMLDFETRARGEGLEDLTRDLFYERIRFYERWGPLDEATSLLESTGDPKDINRAITNYITLPGHDMDVWRIPGDCYRTAAGIARRHGMDKRAKELYLKAIKTEIEHAGTYMSDSDQRRILRGAYDTAVEAGFKNWQKVLKNLHNHTRWGEHRIRYVAPITP
jgi:hypothetical protein